jgi:phytanoyl-CoA hydroxylase
MRYQIDGAAPDGAVQIYEPDLYHADVLAEPLNGLDAIDDAAIEKYRRDGFFAVENAFTEQEVQDARDGISHLVNGGVPDYGGLYFEQFAEGRVEELHGDERLDAVRKLHGYCDVEPRLKALPFHPKVLAIVERILGTEPWMFQDLALLKPPGGREKPWHQDKAYFDLPIDTPVVGVWVCLDEVDPVNGCMFLLEGAHKMGPVIHFMRRDWQICDTDLTDRQHKFRSVAVPLKPGGCMFFDGLLPHGTPTNRSDRRRRAVQFHFAPKDTQRTDKTERMAVFGSDGKDVSC